MRSILTLGFFWLALAVAIGCSDPADSGTQNDVDIPAFVNLDAATEFVGDAACFDCHEDQYQGFKQHGMANSMYRLTPEVAVEAFGSEIVVDSASGLHYATVASDSGYFQIEYLLDERGRRVHELVRPMEWVVGSGTSARTYLVEKDGWFYELPVTWYTQKGRWDFSPGYRVANKRFDRKIADRCVVCHNSYPDPVLQTSGMYTEMPSGIGCERCHGPGGAHVEARLVSDPPGDGPDLTIINPVHLPMERRLDVCQQCHLNGSVSLLREGRTPYDFRPSEALEDYVALYTGLENVQEEGISVISHADRMKQSACYINSLDTLRPMECKTCHDPHQGFREAGDQYFNTTCLTCHAPAALAEIDAPPGDAVHTVDANCVECHMPQADLLEAPHSAFTDHFIRVVREESEMQPQTAGDHDLLTAYFERDGRPSDESRIYEGMAYITRGYQGGFPEVVERGIALLDKAFADGLSSSEALYLHGYAQLTLGRPAEAIPSLEKAVRLEPGKVERLNALAQAYEKTGGRTRDRIEQLYREALRIQPVMADIRTNYGKFLQSNGRFDEARREYEQVVRDESWNANGWYNLGTLALQLGQLEDAENWLDRSRTLNPLNGGTLSNLGLVYLQTNRTAEARKILEDAVSRAPDHPEALENLGSLYLNLELDREAARMLERASLVNPGSADVQAKLALAWFRLEAYSKAELAAKTALGLNPDQPLALQILNAL
jgi:Tfp pilus assembly protein PilF